MKYYKIFEIFYSIQGEGCRQGEPSIFIRFSFCNLSCRIDTHGFDCDTEFNSYRNFTKEEILKECLKFPCRWIVFTGGEPSLQLDQELVDFLKENGFSLAIETNGTKVIPSGLDWITVSPKSADHTIVIKEAAEVKYVRCAGQPIPNTSINAKYYFISPAFDTYGVSAETLVWCTNLVKENPAWRLTIQMHKLLKLR